MHRHQDHALLALWEAGEDPLAMLAAAEPADIGTLAALPVGQRDGALIALHRQLFGPAIAATVTCPTCATTAEVTLDAAVLLAHAGDAGTLIAEAGDAALVRVRHGPWHLVARPADSRDLAAVAALPDLAGAAMPDLAGAAMPDLAGAERALALALVIECRRDGRAVDPAEAPDDVFAALAEALEAADPLAAIALDLACPECGAAIDALHDPALHLAQSVAAHARRLLAEVAVLARAYGWREADILAMSPLRRAAYLDLAA